METLQGVVVLVKGGAVEARQAMLVRREMRRHPVEDHTDTALVAGVDERRKVFWRAVARGRCEHRQGLVAPGATERMLHDRQQLDVGEVELLHVGDQALGQFAPIVEARHFTQVIQLALPGAWVQFIDRQRRTVGMALGAVFHPLLVLP